MWRILWLGVFLTTVRPVAGQTGALRVEVVEQIPQKALPDALIHIRRAENDSLLGEHLTDARGRAFVQGLPQGLYIVTATFAGFIQAEAEATVQAGETRIVRLELAPDWSPMQLEAYPEPSERPAVATSVHGLAGCYWVYDEGGGEILNLKPGGTVVGGGFWSAPRDSTHISIDRGARVSMGTGFTITLGKDPEWGELRAEKWYRTDVVGPNGWDLRTIAVRVDCPEGGGNTSWDVDW